MTLSQLKPGSHIHLMGICGTAMASLAGLLKDRGFKITGSDSNPYPPMSTQLESLGIVIQKPYAAKNLQPRPDFVIVGNVISRTNEEAQELEKQGIPHTSLPQAMGEFIIADRQSIVIAGTHGKTTTTSLMSWVASCCQKKPGFLIGGIAKNFSKSFQNSEGNYFIIEGDEYDTAYFDKVPKFVHYRPKHVILTSIEFDHADIYKDFTAVKQAFEKLMRLIPEDGTLIYCAEDSTVTELAKLCKAKTKIGYGIKNGDIKAKILNIDEKETQFSVNSSTFSMGMSGEYNVLNATAVVVLAQQLGWDQVRLAQALKTFEGVKRRQEILGEPNGILVIEDFAHHPTAVRETIKGIKSKYPKRRLFAVFEPRSATSRRKVFQKDYVTAFELADQTLIAQAFDQGKIEDENRFSSEELVSDIKISGHFAEVYPGVDQIVKDLCSKTRHGDLILIMSNGGFDGIYTKLMHALEIKK